MKLGTKVQTPEGIGSFFNVANRKKNTVHVLFGTKIVAFHTKDVTEYESPDDTGKDCEPVKE